MIGIGGGIIFVPLLHVWSGFPLKKAIATSIACIAPIAAVGALSHGILNQAEFPWLESAALATTAIATAQLGALALRRLPTKQIALMFAILLLVTAMRILIGWHWVEGQQSPGLLSFASIGLASGFASSLFGIGGGVVMVGLMVGLLDMPMILAVTISLTAMVPTTLSGLIAHARAKLVEWHAVLPLAIPAVLFAFFGAYISHIIPMRVLEWIFCGFLLLSVYRILKKALFATHNKER